MSESTVTFQESDKLGRKPFCEKLERFLMVEHDFAEGSLVVSLNAPFGAGKTTFLSMWKSDLDIRRKSDPALPQAIILNTWQSDYCGDPLLSIVTSLIKAAEAEEGENGGKAAAGLREAAKDIGWFVTGLASGFAAHWSGLDATAAAELAEAKRDGRKPKVPDFVTLYEERTAALQNLKGKLREVFGCEHPKALVFVDELDRCRPDYAITYLETIKHVFDVHGLVFVLAVDYEQLKCSGKALFGEHLEFAEYFRKFAQRTISLPEPTETGMRELARHYAAQYVEREGKRVSLLRIDDDCVKNIVELIGARRMIPRQIQETFRIIGHVLVGNQETRGRVHWCLGMGVILMSVLKVGELELYLRIGKGETTPLEVGQYLRKLLNERSALWWFCIYLTGTGDRNDKGAGSFEEMFKNLGFVSEDASFDAQRELGQFVSGWGHSSIDRWEQIYERIETATTF